MVGGRGCGRWRGDRADGIGWWGLLGMAKVGDETGIWAYVKWAWDLGLEVGLGRPGGVWATRMV